MDQNIFLSIIVLISTLLLTAILSPIISFTRQWANPIFILNIPHALLLVAYIVSFERGIITFALGAEAVLLLGLGYLAFLIGVVLVGSIAAHRKGEIVICRSNLEALDRVCRYALLGLALAVAVKYVVAFRTYGSIVGNIVEMRRDYVYGYLDYTIANAVAFLLSSILMLNIGMLIGVGVANRKYLIIFSIFLIIANDVSVGGANWTFTGIGLLFCSWIATKERLDGLSIRGLGTYRITLIVSVAVCIIFLLILFRTSESGGIGMSFGDLVMFYAGGDIAAFGYFVDFPYESYPFGRFTLGGLYGLLEPITTLLGLMPDVNIDEESMVADIGVRFNTAIHFAHYYADFGDYGLVFSSFLLGFISMLAMILYRAKMTIARVQYFVLLLFVILMSIRSVPTEGKYFWACPNSNWQQIISLLSKDFLSPLRTAISQPSTSIFSRSTHFIPCLLMYLSPTSRATSSFNRW